MLNDFRAFLLKANVVGLALAVVIGVAAGALVKAMTDDFIMPIIGVVTPDGDWRKFTVDVGPMKFGVGDFVGVFLNFMIVSLVAWQIGKFFIKPDAPAPPSKTCPFCKSAVDATATRCPHCTSQL